MIGAVVTTHARLERRMRQRRALKVVAAILFAVVWIPVAIIMIVAGASDRRA